MIGARVTRSAVFLVLVQLLAKSLDLIAIVVLARLLTPADFGLVTLAASVMLIANSLTEIPVVEALIGRESVQRADLDSAFTLTALRGLATALSLILLAAPLAWAFEDNRLAMILMILAVGPLVQGLASPSVVHSIKAVDYGILARAQFVGRLAAFVTMMLFAWITRSYWALVAGMVAGPVVTALATHFLAPYRPRLSTERIGSILSFAGWVTLSRVVFTVNQQFDRFFVGAILGKQRLGFYAMAGDLSSMATFLVATPVTQPLFAGFAQMAGDPERLRAAYLRGQQILFTVVAPIGCLFAVLADPVVHLVLGAAWLETVPLIQWLAPAIAVQLLILPAHALVMALNRPGLLVWRELLSLILRLPPTLLAAWWFGLVAAAGARALAAVIMTLAVLAVARRLIDVSLWQQLTNCARAGGALAAMVAVTLVLYGMSPTPSTVIGRVFELAGLVSAGLGVYGAVLFTLWHLAGRPDGAERWALGLAGRFIRS